LKIKYSHTVKMHNQEQISNTPSVQDVVAMLELDKAENNANLAKLKAKIQFVILTIQSNVNNAPKTLQACIGAPGENVNNNEQLVVHANPTPTPIVKPQDSTDVGINIMSVKSGNIGSSLSFEFTAVENRSPSASHHKNRSFMAGDEGKAKVEVSQIASDTVSHSPHYITPKFTQRMKSTADISGREVLDAGKPTAITLANDAQYQLGLISNDCMINVLPLTYGNMAQNLNTGVDGRKEHLPSHPATHI
jgi:hypothetical protein